MNAIRNLSNDDFPPYGRMVHEYEADIRGDGTPPPDWSGVMAWSDWRGKVLDILNAILWPRYDYPTRSWIGRAKSQMAQVTEVDFVLLKNLTPNIDERVPELASRMTHYDLFMVEDEGDAVDPATGVRIDRSLDKTLRRYLEGKADAWTIDALASGFLPGLVAKAGSVDLQLKRFLQRPRAYQLCVMLGHEWFTHRHAKSAVTPAMISGHAFQGGLGGVAALYRATGLGASKHVLQTVARHAVEVGDRRVFAGVHYPSDNLASWIVALLISPLVCPDHRGRTWLWTAIRESVVYRAMLAAADADERHVYRRPIDLLVRLGENPGLGVDEASRMIQ